MIYYWHHSDTVVYTEELCAHLLDLTQLFYLSWLHPFTLDDHFTNPVTYMKGRFKYGVCTFKDIAKIFSKAINNFIGIVHGQSLSFPKPTVIHSQNADIMHEQFYVE